MKIRLLRPLKNYVDLSINKNTNKLKWPKYSLEGPDKNVEVLGIANENRSQELINDSELLQTLQELSQAEENEFLDLLIPSFLLDLTDMFYYLIIQDIYPEELSNENKEKYYKVAEYLQLGSILFAKQKRHNLVREQRIHGNNKYFGWLKNINANNYEKAWLLRYRNGNRSNVNVNLQQNIQTSYEEEEEDYEAFKQEAKYYGGKRKTRKLKRRVRQSKRTVRAKRR